MEFLKRKVFLTKYLVPVDSDNDGVLDSLTLSATTKTLQIPLVQSFDDIGIYDTISEEDQIPFEVIDFGNMWDETNDGSDDGGTGGNGEIIPVDWGSGDGGVGSNGEDTLELCDDPNATNYIGNALRDYYAQIGQNITTFGCEYGQTNFDGTSESGGFQDYYDYGGLTTQKCALTHHENQPYTYQTVDLQPSIWGSNNFNQQAFGDIIDDDIIETTEMFCDPSNGYPYLSKPRPEPSFASQLYPCKICKLNSANSLYDITQYGWFNLDEELPNPPGINHSLNTYAYWATQLIYSNQNFMNKLIDFVEARTGTGGYCPAGQRLLTNWDFNSTNPDRISDTQGSILNWGQNPTGPFAGVQLKRMDSKECCTKYELQTYTNPFGSSGEAWVCTESLKLKRFELCFWCTALPPEPPTPPDPVDTSSDIILSPQSNG